MRAWPLPTLFEGVFCIIYLFCRGKVRELAKQIMLAIDQAPPTIWCARADRIGRADSAKAARAVMEMVVKTVSFIRRGRMLAATSHVHGAILISLTS